MWFDTKKEFSLYYTSRYLILNELFAQLQIFMHSDPTEVLKHIPKECVPSDLGGCDKSIKELGGTC